MKWAKEHWIWLAAGLGILVLGGYVQVPGLSLSVSAAKGSAAPVADPVLKTGLRASEVLK